MIEIAFVGSCVNMKELSKFPAASVAGNKYQLGLISLFQDDDFNVTQIIHPVFAAFPRSRKIFVTKKVLPDNNTNRQICSYINIPFIKQVTMSVSLFINLLKWNRQNRSSQHCVIMYNVYSYRDLPLRIFCWLKHVPRILSIADVTEKGYGFWTDRECGFEKRNISKYNGLLPITDLIHTDYAPKLPYYRIEGGIAESVEYIPNTATNGQVKTIVFTGTLNQYSNIEILLESFKKINDSSIRLIIAGSGELEHVVSDSAQTDERISFLGRVSPKRALTLQQEADILVSPRIPDNFVTKYTFPSKLIEYLSSGNTVVAFPLQGIPVEYKTFIVFPSEVSSNALAETLVNSKPNGEHAKRRQLAFVNGKRWEDYSDGATELVRTITKNFYNDRK